MKDEQSTEENVSVETNLLQELQWRNLELRECMPVEICDSANTDRDYGQSCSNWKDTNVLARPSD